MTTASDIILSSTILEVLAMQSEKLRRLSRGRTMSISEAGELMDETGRLYLDIASAIRKAIFTTGDDVGAAPKS